MCLALCPWGAQRGGNLCFVCLRTPRRSCSVCGVAGTPHLEKAFVTQQMALKWQTTWRCFAARDKISLLSFSLCFGQRAPFVSVEISHFCHHWALSLAKLPWFSCLVLSHLGRESFPVPKLICVSQYPAAFLLYSKACLLNSAPGIRRIQRMLWKREWIRGFWKVRENTADIRDLNPEGFHCSIYIPKSALLCIPLFLSISHLSIFFFL